MTKEQFEHIQGLLEEWRAVRNLSVEDQKKNFKVNYTKELLEFFEAERDGNEYEMVDAICDMIITAINAGRGLSSPYITGDINIAYEVVLLAYDSDFGMGIIELCNLLRYYGYNPYQCLLETVKELETRTGAWNEKEGKWCKDVGAYTFEEADRIVSNYDTENERELYEDNTEFWRWQLHIKGEYCSFKVKKWYKADYSGCKLAEQDPF